MKSPQTAVRKLEEWLRRNSNQRSMAIILGSSVNGLSFARSLGRRGVRTLLLDNERLIGTYTAYGEFIEVPSVDEYPEGWIGVLQYVASQLEAPPILFATSDTFCVALSQNAELLKQHFRFLIPDADTMERIINKRLQYDIAQKSGISVPKSHFPNSAEELRALTASLPYPCLLKPYKSHLARRRLSKKALVMDSQAELISAYERFTLDGIALMVQEIVPGETTALFGYLAFWDAQGRERAWVTKKKLRQYPPAYGDGSLQVTVEAPEVVELSRRLLQTFHYSGFVGVEFKVDSRDGTYRLMEINPRTVSGNQLAISAGVDFPWIGYQYLSGGEAEIDQPNRSRTAVKCVNEEWDLQAYLALRKMGTLGFWRWLGSLRGSKSTIAAWDDPLPLIAGIWRLLRAAWYDLRSRLTRSPSEMEVLTSELGDEERT